MALSITKHSPTGNLYDEIIPRGQKVAKVKDITSAVFNLEEMRRSRRAKNSSVWGGRSKTPQKSTAGAPHSSSPAPRTMGRTPSPSGESSARRGNGVPVPAPPVELPKKFGGKARGLQGTLMASRMRSNVRDKLLARYGNARSVFRSIDKDGDGSLTADEFQTSLEDLNIGATKREMQCLVNVLDTDGDGQVSFEEFAAWLEPSSQSLGQVLSGNSGGGGRSGGSGGGGKSSKRTSMGRSDRKRAVFRAHGRSSSVIPFPYPRLSLRAGHVSRHIKPDYMKGRAHPFLHSAKDDDDGGGDIGGETGQNGGQNGAGKPSTSASGTSKRPPLHAAPSSKWSTSNEVYGLRGGGGGGSGSALTSGQGAHIPPPGTAAAERKAKLARYESKLDLLRSRKRAWVDGAAKRNAAALAADERRVRSVMGQRIKYYESLKVRLEADAARRRRDEMR